jgi:acetyl esterase/lipase
MQNVQCKIFTAVARVCILYCPLIILHFAFLLAPIARVFAGDLYKVTPDVVYGHKAGMALTFDVIHPRKPNGVAVLFMMSGGWVSSWVQPAVFFDSSRIYVHPFIDGSLRQIGTLADHGYTLFIVRHGSSPQFKVPDAVADVRRAVRYIRLHAADFDIDPNRIGVCGGSAGGHLSLILGTASDEGDKKSKDEVEQTSDRVAAVVAFFPPVDLREWVGKMTDKFPALAFDPKQAESVSPLLYVSPDDPPTLLVHGDKDGLVKLDNSERILAAFQKAKVPCELKVIKGAGHGFIGEQGVEASTALIAWFDKYLAKPAAPGNNHKAEKEKTAATP